MDPRTLGPWERYWLRRRKWLQREWAVTFERLQPFLSLTPDRPLIRPEALKSSLVGEQSKCQVTVATATTATTVGGTLRFYIF